MHTISWHIGCSGFYYKSWKEVFYPKGWPQKKWFDYYWQHFSTIEINNTFYRFPELQTVKSWYDRSPEGFVFSIKVPKIITHEQQFVETELLLQEFYALIHQGFAEKLGAILFQLPPHFSYDTEKLHLMIKQLDPAFTNVVEFRNESWWRPDVYALLQKHNITFCSVSYPGLTNDVIRNTSTVYYRFHGVPRLYFSEYNTDFLRHVFHLIDEDPKVENAFIFFNNTAVAAALPNARYMQELAQKPNYLL
ncbi:MAG: DUF72 domain-containing protein [Flavisolibacter sp.]|nr:DUF72 domain-containing protein [Flavisolibacter sp.]